MRQTLQLLTASANVLLFPSKYSVVFEESKYVALCENSRIHGDSLMDTSGDTSRDATGTEPAQFFSTASFRREHHFEKQCLV